MKICLYFSNDLLFSSRVKPVAQQNGYEVKFPGFEEGSLEPAPELIIVDLEFVSKDDLIDLMQAVDQLEDRPRVVAYAPHVKVNLLNSASELGIEQVWSRGQFNKGFAGLFV